MRIQGKTGVWNNYYFNDHYEQQASHISDQGFKLTRKNKRLGSHVLFQSNIYLTLDPVIKSMCFLFSDCHY